MAKKMKAEPVVEEKGYNGWTNYETWLVALWLDNEQGSSDFWREKAKDIANEGRVNKLTGTETGTYDLSRMMKNEIEDGAPTLEGFYADLLNAALSEVNWYEIAKHYMEELTNG